MIIPAGRFDTVSRLVPHLRFFSGERLADRGPCLLHFSRSLGIIRHDSGRFRPIESHLTGT